MKSRFWHIQIAEKDRYKMTFIVSLEYYEWNVMPFGIKNAPSEFQHIMNNILNDYSKFSIAYIDYVLIYSKILDQHLKHLKTFFKAIKRNGLAISAPKIKSFQTKIWFLGHDISSGTIKPIQQCIKFADKFTDEFKDVFGFLKYVADFS